SEGEDDRRGQCFVGAAVARAQSSLQRGGGRDGGRASRGGRGTPFVSDPQRPRRARGLQRLHGPVRQSALPIGQADLSGRAWRQSDDRVAFGQHDSDPLRRALPGLPRDRREGSCPGGLCPPDPPEFSALAAYARGGNTTGRRLITCTTTRSSRGILPWGALPP